MLEQRQRLNKRFTVGDVDFIESFMIMGYTAPEIAQKLSYRLGEFVNALDLVWVMEDIERARARRR